MYHSNGICRGKLGKKEVGKNGFGYDPIFIPDEGNGRTFSDMTKIEKSSISHRFILLLAGLG